MIYVSETPCNGGPPDMKVQLSYLETAEWKDDDVFQYFTTQKIDEMVMTYKSLENPDLKVSNIIRKRFYAAFAKLLINVIICRTCETKWFGKIFVDLFPKYKKHIEVELKPEWKDAISKFKRVELDDLRKDYRSTKLMTAKTFVDRSRKLRICYSFPVLFSMFLKGDIDLTWNEVISNG
jgi:hypothetical protein